MLITDVLFVMETNDVEGIKTKDYGVIILIFICSEKFLKNWKSRILERKLILAFCYVCRSWFEI